VVRVMTDNQDIHDFLEELEKEGYEEKTGSFEVTVGEKTYPVHSFDTSPTLKGVFVEVFKNHGNNKSNVYIFETKNGEVAVWGSAVLDRELEELESGKMVGIAYLGKSKTQAGRTVKNYKVYIK